MSGSVGKIFDPIGGALGLYGSDKKDDPAPEAPAAEPAAPAPKPAEPVADVGPKNEKIEDRTGDLATREQSINQRAGAAGAMRSDNDADVLGYVLPRKRSAGRAILG